MLQSMSSNMIFLFCRSVWALNPPPPTSWRIWGPSPPTPFSWQPGAGMALVPTPMRSQQKLHRHVGLLPISWFPQLKQKAFHFPKHSLKMFFSTRAPNLKSSRWEEGFGKWNCSEKLRNIFKVSRLDVPTRMQILYGQWDLSVRSSDKVTSVQPHI